MQRKAILAATLAMMMTLLLGCGGGGGDKDDGDIGESVGREVMAGAGSTAIGGATTVKR